MRTAEIKAGVPYATCDGNYVVPVEPVKSTYQYLMVPKKGGVGQERRVVDTAGSVDPENPWGKCHTVDPEGSYRTGKKGVKVRTYKYVDAEGNPQGDPVEVVVSPRDIGGTWKEYMTLYAHVVKSAAEERDYQRLLRESETAIAEALKIPSATIGTSARYNKSFRRVSRAGTWEIKLSIPLEDDHEAEQHRRAIQVAESVAVTVREVLGLWGLDEQ